MDERSDAEADARWRLENFLIALRELPRVSAVSYRGSIALGRQPGDLLLTEGITSTSADIAVATAGFATDELTVVIGVSGRDISRFSAVPDALELVFPPGVLFRFGPVFNLDDLKVQLVEECVLSPETGFVSPETDINSLKNELPNWVAASRRQPMVVDPEYCRRFSAPLE